MPTLSKPSGIAKKKATKEVEFGGKSKKADKKKSK